MKITVRLYRQNDMDLIGLACSDGVSVSKELKKVLVAFVRGLPYGIQLTPKNVSDVIASKKQIQLQFYLEESKYMDVITWLKTLRPRQRNSFLKNLLRSSLPCPYLYMYQTDEQLVDGMIEYINSYGRISPSSTVSTPTTDPIINPTKSVIKKTPEKKQIEPPKNIEHHKSSITNIEKTQENNDSSNISNSDEEDMLFDALLNM